MLLTKDIDCNAFAENLSMEVADIAAVPARAIFRAHLH